jgi:hypothetical protein
MSVYIGTIGLGLGELEEIEAQMFHKPLKLIEVRMFKFSTSAPTFAKPMIAVSYFFIYVVSIMCFRDYKIEFSSPCGSS